MRRWWLRISIILLVLFAFLVRNHLKNRAQAEREAGYQSTLRAYEEDLKPGMKRQEVEDYLHAQNKTFKRMCCVDRSDGNVWDDLVNIGEEDAPWVCSRNSVYIALDFFDNRREKERTTTSYPDDTLKAVTVYHHLEGCM